MKVSYLDSFEKYKNYKLPLIGEIFRHPTETRSGKSIEYRVIEYSEDKGLVETVHSKRRLEKTLHWIRKMYNKEKGD